MSLAGNFSPEYAEAAELAVRGVRVKIMRLSFVAAAWCWALPAAAAQPIVCPDSITVSESGDQIAGWTTSAPRLSHSFAGITVVNGPQGEEDYSLHPDDETEKGRHLTQVWKLSDYRDHPLHLLCRYEDTAVTLSANLPDEIQTCTITFPFDKKTGVIEDPGDPPRMSCR